MKKLFIFALLVFSFVESNAQITSKPAWPFGCRKHSISIGGVYSTDVTLCCSPQLWSIPPISCIEIENVNKNEVQVYYQYAMLDEIEMNLKTTISDKFILVYSENDLVENDTIYRVVKKEYPIQINDLKQRFIKLEFIKN